MGMLEMNDRKKIGLGLTGFGVLFTFLGVIFFFDKGLLAMGNILFLSGMTLTIGFKSTWNIFLNKRNHRGSAAFLGGLFLVLIGWPFIGMIVEAYGFVYLFSGFWPTAQMFLLRVPVLGWILNQPFFRQFGIRKQERVTV
ncbi:vesicle transport protein [Klebsormidium nitens]|uniref:Vesicle transport protein n=1 Tax=Klebsormidium nitens TaxID=105231 RepID=A0A1Y1I791_KLENI|nr:vesicle transport protein [Klebsormidium nitens]|eukprot:TRINITY_DN17839_c0_g1_i1.p1 TRINITY_DN17839_c0_g1~~TRINITY_DN17839_c0_g1_i1.p1  ORF type:complete len:140 (-),score=11.61 TRINITY_DN17839_c0_g1_i1:256-675(-)